MTRWLDRIEKMAEKGEGEIDPIELRDFFISFFQNCFHLKDYLENDSNVDLSKSDLDSFIASSEQISICADICNATKHLSLYGSGWSGEDPEIANGAKVTVYAREGKSSATYTIETATGDIDAYQLAKECRKKWDLFLQSVGLPIP